jgi:4'-phosphopantetheinyl transferase
MNREWMQILSAQEPLELSEGDVHVWAVSLDLDDRALQACECVLSPDEAARAARFVLLLHRTRFAAARGVLRTILSRYAGTEPAKIGFSYGARGKPRLSAESVRNGLEFNVSHAGDRALVAVTRGRGIGVDIESIGTRAHEADIARRFFTPGEDRTLRSADESARPALFAAFWARKEACIKASGLGLFLSLDSFDVSAGAREPRVVESAGGDTQGGRSWTLADVEAASGYAAACAVEGRGLRIMQGEFRF